MTAAPANFAEGVTPVTAPADDADAAVRHRRRGAVLEEAIRRAVFDELTEVGYAAFTIESVASRARTGKASIYRRWPTKQELVVDSFCARFGETMSFVEESVDDATPTRDILVQVVTRMCEAVREGAEAIRAAACEVSRDQELAAILDQQVRCQKRGVLLDVLHRGVRRGDVRPDAPLELVVDLLPAMIMYRLILQNEEISADHLVGIVDDLAMPLLRRA